MPSQTATSATAVAVSAALTNEIRAEMVRHGETITSATAHFGLDRTSIGRKLNARSILSVADLLGFADWLGVSAADLLARAEATAAAKRTPSKRPGRAA